MVIAETGGIIRNEYAYDRAGRKTGRDSGRQALQAASANEGGVSPTTLPAKGGGASAAASSSTSSSSAKGGGASAATRPAMGGGASAATKSASKKVMKVPVFVVRRYVLDAKIRGEKLAEGRLEKSIRGLALDRQGGLVKYLCGRHVTSFRVLSVPEVHTSIWVGVQKVGWKYLMPWAGSLEECVRVYCCFFSGRNMDVDQAKRWDADTRKSCFVTWFDTQVVGVTKEPVVPPESLVPVNAVRGYVIGEHLGSEIIIHIYIYIYIYIH